MPEGGTEQLSGVSSVEIPKRVSREWVEQALLAGKIEKGNKTFFVRKFPETTTEKIWLTDTYGLPTSGPEGVGYIYHGTSAESLPDIVDHGIFGVPEHPTISGDATDEVKSTAINRTSKIGKGIVAIWRTSWRDVEIPTTAWPEPMGWPSGSFDGDRSSLPIPEHLKKASDLRQLPSDNLIGFYIVDQEK